MLCKNQAYVIKRQVPGTPKPTGAQVTWSRHGGPVNAWKEALQFQSRSLVLVANRYKLKNQTYHFLNHSFGILFVCLFVSLFHAKCRTSVSPFDLERVGFVSNALSSGIKQIQKK